MQFLVLLWGEAIAQCGLLHHVWSATHKSRQQKRLEMEITC